MEKIKNFEESYAELVELCKRENRLPNPKYGKEEGRLKGFIQRYRNDPKIIDIKEAYKKGNSFEENLQDLIEFCKREERLPNPKYGKDEGRLKGFIQIYRKDPRITRIREHYRQHNGGGWSNFEKNLQDFIKFCKENNRLPQSRHEKEETKLNSFMVRYKNDPRIVETKEKYVRGGNSFDQNYAELVEFCKKEGKLPQSKPGKKEETRLKGFLDRYKNDPRIVEIKERYSRRKKEV